MKLFRFTAALAGLAFMLSFLSTAGNSWETRTDNGFVTKTRLRDGEFAEEIVFDKSGRKILHRFSDMQNRSHIVSFDPQSGEESSHSITR